MTSPIDNQSKNHTAGKNFVRLHYDDCDEIIVIFHNFPALTRLTASVNMAF